MRSPWKPYTSSGVVEMPPLKLSTQSANNFSPNLSLTANLLASCLPYTFVHSEVALWVSDVPDIKPNCNLCSLLEEAAWQSSAAGAKALHLDRCFTRRRSGIDCQKHFWLQSISLVRAAAVEGWHARDLCDQRLWYRGSPPLWRRAFTAKKVLNPPMLWEYVTDVKPRNVSILPPSNRKLSLHKVACLPVPLIWHNSAMERLRFRIVFWNIAATAKKIVKHSGKTDN